MPRTLARESAQAAASFPHRYAARLHQLRTQLPLHDRALIGRHAIIQYLCDLGVYRRNRHPVSWRMLTRWRRDKAFPLLSAACVPTIRRYTPALSTTHAITAWLLEQAALPSIFHLHLPKDDPGRLTSGCIAPSGCAPTTRAHRAA